MIRTGERIVIELEGPSGPRARPDSRMSDGVWTLIFPIVLATVFNFMFEPMRSTGSVEAVDVAVVADDAWEDSPFSQVVDTLSEADEPLLAVHPVAGEKEAHELIAEGSVAGAYVVDAVGGLVHACPAR